MDNENKNPHEGHRERMRNRFEQAKDLSSFSEHEVAEMLLYPYVSRKNTNELAHALIERFHSLERVLGASIEELESVEGMNHNIAVSISFIRQMMIYTYKKNAEMLTFNNKDELYKAVMRSFLWEPKEKVRAILLSNALQVIKSEVIATGDFYKAEIDLSLLVRLTLNSKCNYVILAHNHPNGSCIPSEQDIIFTEKLCRKLREYGIKILDHLIITDNKYLSMSDTMMVEFNIND